MHISRKSNNIQLEGLRQNQPGEILKHDIPFDIEAFHTAFPQIMKAERAIGTWLALENKLQALVGTRVLYWRPKWELQEYSKHEVEKSTSKDDSSISLSV